MISLKAEVKLVSCWIEAQSIQFFAGKDRHGETAVFLILGAIRRRLWHSWRAGNSRRQNQYKQQGRYRIKYAFFLILSHRLYPLSADRPPVHHIRKLCSAFP